MVYTWEVVDLVVPESLESRSLSVRNAMRASSSAKRRSSARRA
jgi:hypothetical protein